MPKGSRRSQLARQGYRELDVERARGGERIEHGADGEWHVRSVRSAEKRYRCPGCEQEIVPHVAHVVVWSAAGLFGDERALAERRHWHASCWRERARRR